MLGEFQQLKPLISETMPAAADMARVEECLAMLGDHPFPKPCSELGIDLAKAREWSETVAPVGVMKSGAFSAGAGRFIDVLDEWGEPADRDFATGALERLLRHVEVNRQNGLSRSWPESARHALLMEQFDIAILFSRSSVRRKDLRLLNTAFKMNDWSFLKWHRNPGRLTVQQRARLIQSIAEQEYAARELL
jgi:hypothetical protein